MTIEPAVEAYVAFYESLSPDNVGQLDRLCTPDVRFRDPFNDLTGLAAYRTVLTKMFEDVETPRFSITDRAISGRVCYLRWDFHFEPKGGGAPWLIEGMTEVHFNDAGLVTAHLDHWDSGRQFYGRLPLLGWLIRLVQRRLSVRSDDANGAAGPG